MKDFAHDAEPDDIGPSLEQCAGCGVPFYPEESGPGAEYCSVACYQWDTQPPPDVSELDIY